MTDEIEFEQVTIKVPKRIMAFLRFRAGEHDIQVEAEIEGCVLDDVRGLLEGFEGQELIGFLEMDRVFYEMLGDENYKPKKPKATDQEVKG
jgi:hypothetical protein